MRRKEKSARAMILLLIVILSALPIAVYARPQESMGQSIDGSVEFPTFSGSSSERMHKVASEASYSYHTSAVQSATGTITISGTLRYSVAPIDQGELGMDRPMRYVQVCLLDQNIGNPIYPEYELVAIASTVSNGYFQFTVDNLEHTFGDAPGMDPVVAVDALIINVAEVYEPSLWPLKIPKRFLLPLCGVDVPDGFNYDFGTRYPVDSQAPNEPFQALDACLDIFDFVYENSGISWQRHSVEIWWPTDNDQVAHSHGDAIHLQDRTAFDWSHHTVYHEYAHCILYDLYGDHWVPGGTDGPDPHHVYSESNGGFALTEGWAEFMACEVEGNFMNVARAYTDSSGVTHQGNMETNDWYKWIDSMDMDGDVVEGSVASIFWDMCDGEDPADNDFMQIDGFYMLFQLIRNERPGNILEFWDKWIAAFMSPDHSVGPLCTIFWQYGIDVDTYPPYFGAVVIEGGNPFTNSPTLHVTLSARDAGEGVAFYRLAFERVWTGSTWDYLWGPWLAFVGATMETTVVLDGDGMKYVYAQFADYRNQVSDLYWDSIKLDMTRPTVDSLLVDPQQFPWKLVKATAGKPYSYWVFTGTYTEITFGVDEPCHVEIEIVSDNGAQTLVKSMVTDITAGGGGGVNMVWTGAMITWKGRIKQVPTGLYEIRIRVTDRAGNQAAEYPIVTHVYVFWRNTPLG